MSKTDDLTCKVSFSHVYIVVSMYVYNTRFTSKTPPAESAFIRPTHALSIKLICRDSGTGEFWEIFKSIILSQDEKHQNTLWQLYAMGSSFDGEYSQ